MTREPRRGKKMDPEIVIAVMGATGSGKSSFINLISKSHLAVSDGLRSCTSEVQPSNSFELDGRSVTLVDTPGFDDTMISDTDILRKIAVYMASTYENGFKLTGVIYIHRITDIRVGGMSKRNFRMLRQLCGDETLQNVAIVTNMWDAVAHERGAAREQELKTDEQLFKPVLDKGAQMFRHDNTLQSARNVIAHYINKSPQVLRIQHELVDDKRDIDQTAAGIELHVGLEALKKKHEKELDAVRREMREMLEERDAESKRELEETRKHLENRILEIETNRRRLAEEYERERQHASEQIRSVLAALRREQQLRLERERDIANLRGDTDSVVGGPFLPKRQVKSNFFTKIGRIFKKKP